MAAFQHSTISLSSTSPCFGAAVDASGVHNGGSSSSTSSANGGGGLTTLGGNGGGAAASALGSVNKPAADVDYLTALLKDKKQLAAFPNVFQHIERLLDDGERDERPRLTSPQILQKSIAFASPSFNASSQTSRSPCLNRSATWCRGKKKCSCRSTR